MFSHHRVPIPSADPAVWCPRPTPWRNVPNAVPEAQDGGPHQKETLHMEWSTTRERAKQCLGIKKEWPRGRYIWYDNGAVFYPVRFPLLGDEVTWVGPQTKIHKRHLALNTVRNIARCLCWGMQLKYLIHLCVKLVAFVRTQLFKFLRRARCPQRQPSK